MIVPDVIIAGWPKCGTTSLYEWLCSHPDVVAPLKKETYFLSEKIMPRLNGKASFIEDGIYGYKNLYPNINEYNNKILIDATPSYYKSQVAIKVISEIIDSKIILLVRRPSQIAYSFYRFDKYNQEIIDKNTTFPEYMNSTLSNERFGENLVNLDMYYWITKWIDHIGSSRVRVYSLGKIKSNTELMLDLSKWIGIDGAFYLNYKGLYNRNQTKSIKNKIIHKYLLGIRKYIPEMLISNLRNRYYELNKEEIKGPTDLDRKILEQIDIKLSTSINNTEKLIYTKLV